MAATPNHPPEADGSNEPTGSIDRQLEDRLATSPLQFSAGSEASDSFDPELAIDCLASDPTMTQLVLRNEIDGRTYLTIYQKLHFSADLQTQVVHVPFEPPLPEVPQIEAALDDEINARLRITDCQKFGARLEVVLAVENSQSVDRTLVLNVAETSPERPSLTAH